VILSIMSSSRARGSRIAMVVGWLIWGVIDLVGFGAAALADIEKFAGDPILRLDLPGHTGEVRALAFSADSTRLISGGRDKVAIVWTLDPALIPDDGDTERTSRNIARRRLKERNLRWQVARGTRGVIQAIAVSSGTARGLVALAGSGAMGSTGEILLLDANSGSLVKTLGGGDRPGHRQSVAALAFTTDGGWLVSQDLDGQIFAWKRADEWQAVELAGREEARFGRDGAAALRKMPPLRPLAAIGASQVAVPKLVSSPVETIPVWRIQIIDLLQPQAPARVAPGDHLGIITALSATPDGGRIASADLSGRVMITTPGGEAPIAWAVGPTVESLAILPDGKRLAIGVAAEAAQAARLELWEVTPPRRLDSRPMPAAVRAVQVSPDGTRLAWTGGERQTVLVAPLPTFFGPPDGQQGKGIIRLGGVGQTITRVTFSTAAADARKAAAEEPAATAPDEASRNILRRRKRDDPVGEASNSTPPRRLAISTRPPAAEGSLPLDAAFDLGALARTTVGEEGDWAVAAGRPAGWSLRRAATDQTPRGIDRWELSRQGKPAGRIDFALDWQGRVSGNGSAIAWITRAGNREPWAVAIGTDRGISIYALEAGGSGPSRLVRWFRGHEDRVLSLAISEDARWLASGGGDALVMLWSLSDIDRNLPLTDRWGVELAVKNGRAVIDAIDEAGPLAGKGVRVGDVITKVSWAEGAAVETRVEHAEAEAIRRALAAVPWNAQVAFVTEREGKPLEAFNRLPAWENIAALHLAANREWAFWTPRGYYAASANGDTLFGWLVNRGLDRLPRFFKAQQFRRKLERPDVMSRLLAEGSLDAALRAIGRDVPQSSASVLPEQLSAAPEVRILTPRPGEQAQGDALTVTAEVEIPAGVEVDRVKAYASGAVAAAEPRVIASIPAAAGRLRRELYEWRLDLPAEDQHLVQVFAGTREGPTDTCELRVDARAAPPSRRRQPRLYLLASGIDDYARNQFDDFVLEDLRFAVDDAQAVRESLSNRTLDLYDLTADRLLVDGEVTRDNWKSAVADLSRRIAGHVEPDDLLVFFLAGHGLINPETNSYAYLCHDVALKIGGDGEPLPSAGGSITWQDFRVLAGIPCRKLALVDTCHSAALGPGTRSTTVREFQENMIMVLAAASDDEPSKESDAWGHGAFTKVLLDALAGTADVGWNKGLARIRNDSRRQSIPTLDLNVTGGPDGIVSLDEVIDYVLAKVPELTRQGADEATAQHPTISPEGLVPYVKVPLSAVIAGPP